jgi:hypothetical protein
MDKEKISIKADNTQQEKLARAEDCPDISIS